MPTEYVEMRDLGDETDHDPFQGDLPKEGGVSWEDLLPTDPCGEQPENGFQIHDGSDLAALGLVEVSPAIPV